MAFSAITAGGRPSLLGSCSNTHTPSSSPSRLAVVSFARYPVSVRLSSFSLTRGKLFSVRSAAAPPVLAAAAAEGIKPAITLTEDALKHLNRMRSERSEDLCLRIGVRQGGCSGMSYTMDFENKANARPDDSIIEYNGFVIVCDPKSLLFIFGMQLDYSDALIGGGFSFKNPNASQTCGCGKSFNAEM